MISWIRGEESRLQEARAKAVRLGTRVGKAFSADAFTRMFGSQVMREGWMMSRSLTIWRGLALVCYLQAVDSLQGVTGERFQYCIASGHERILSEWNLTKDEIIALDSFMGMYVEEIMRSYKESTNDLEHTQSFFSAFAERILGNEVPFRFVTRLELLLNGYEFRCEDPIVLANLSSLFIETLVAGKSILQ